MPADPFAPLTRKHAWQARLRRLSSRLARPLRPNRVDPGRPGPPNLLLIGVDTLRADHLGLAGYGPPTSPVLDRLGAGGTVFTDVTAPAPWTLPSFAGALCGMMPGLHGAYLPGPTRNMDSQPPRRLEPGAATLAAHLGDRGYRTAAFYSNQFFAFGLAETFGHHRYRNLAAPDLAGEALDWIRRRSDRPWFCFVLFNDPHEPTTPPPGDLEAFLPPGGHGPAYLRGLARWGEGPAPDLGRARLPLDEAARRALGAKLAIYDATIRQVDRTVGILQDRLEDWGLADRTLVSVFSDHGEEFLDHAAFSRNWNHDPRGIHGVGHGHTHFHELLGVPWLAWGPGVPASVRRNDPVALIDLAPTLLDWLGLPPLPLDPGRAEDLASLLLGRSQAGDPDPGERVLLSEAIAYGPDLVAVRKGRWKLVAGRDGRPLALFDLETDPGELADVAGANPGPLADLQGILAAWRRSGLGASGEGGGSWDDLDATVRQRLKDLGYAD